MAKGTKSKGKEPASIIENGDEEPVDPKLVEELSSFMEEVGLKKSKTKTKTKPKDDKKPRPAPKATPAPPPPAPPPTQLRKGNASLLIPPESKWYSSIPALPASSSSATPTPEQLLQISSRASQLFTKDAEIYQSSAASSSNSSSSEANFLSKIIQSGTLSDRLSALTLLVQGSPVHNTKALENLKNMAERGKGKGGREESLKALRCIVDWWVGGGAPDRKLKYFRDQPILHPDVTDVHLVLWYFEDWLKKYFFSILQILETLCSDTLPYVRVQSLNLISILLRAKPEQEQNLLRLLVNKLGDHEKSICSRASFHILQLLQAHPSMKAIVIREIASLIFKPQATTITPTSTATNKHIRFTDDDTKSKGKAPEQKKDGNPHARYYAAITLNQVILASNDKPVALQLMDVYFELFKAALGEGSLDDDAKESEKPKKEKEDEQEDEEVKKDKKGRVLVDERLKKKKVGKHVQGAAGFMEMEDSQSKLISAILTGINRALPFAKVTAEDVGLQKHIDTLFAVTHKSTFNISLQALVLIQQIASSLSHPTSQQNRQPLNKTTKSIVDRYYRTLYASLHDPRMPHSSKQAMYLNLFFKSVKQDTETERVRAFVKRFVQVLGSGGSGATEFVVGGLFLLGELFSSVQGLRSAINSPGDAVGDDEYDPKKREPLYAHAGSTALWELTPLLHHYHPAVSLHARQLLASQPLSSSPDLSLNTLSHFLDRFVYKNPKKIKEGDEVGISGVRAKGSSMMQPAASGVDGGASGVKLVKGEVGDPGGLVNEESFLKKREEDIPVDQVFFHKYFVRKHEMSKAAKKVMSDGEDSEDEHEEETESEVNNEDDDDESEANVDGDADATSDEEGSELDEDEVWKAMKASMPKEGDDDDILDDEDDSDLDLDMDSDEGEDEDLDEEDKDAGEEDKGDDGDDDDDDDDDALEFVEDSDAEDLIPLDEAFPEGLVEYEGPDADSDDEEEWGGISETKKRKREGDSKQSRRKKLKSLPTFASYEDYAKMIEADAEDNI